MKKTLLIAGLLFIGSILLTGCAGPNNSTTGAAGSSSSSGNGLTMPSGPLFADSDVPVDVDTSSGTGPTLSTGDWKLYMTAAKPYTQAQVYFTYYLEFTKVENSNDGINAIGIATATCSNYDTLSSFIQSQNIGLTWSTITQSGSNFSANATPDTTAPNIASINIIPSSYGYTTYLKKNSAETKFKLSSSMTTPSGVESMTYYYQKR